MRRQDNSTHEIPSFARYLNKVFDFRTATAGLQDARQSPDISPQSVFLAAFYSFVFRLPSFQQLESDLAQPYLQHWIGSDRPFGDDVLRYSLCGFDVTGLEEMLVQSNRTLKRGKVFEEGRVQGRIVAALDGVGGTLQLQPLLRLLPGAARDVEARWRQSGAGAVLPPGGRLPDHQQPGQIFCGDRVAPAWRRRGDRRFTLAR
jgi:hypothetical protein